MDELKSRCLGQLEIISKKRLLSIIEGQEMDSSSSESGNGAANNVSANNVSANNVSAMDIVQESPVVEASQAVTDTCKV